MPTLSEVSNKISPALAAALPSLLAESPDPDAALLLFDRLITESPEVAHLLDQHNFLAHYAIVIFGNSRFLGETLIQNPDVLHSFLRERNLGLSFSADHFQQSLSRFCSRSFEKDGSLLLARFKRREYLRIMLRDVLKIAPLAETTAEISALADVLIAEALRDAQSNLQRRFGTPQHLDSEARLVDTQFCVLSLGKLGGNELNYSSDIDLMFIFADGWEPSGSSITNREYFIRLSQELTSTLSRVTLEGPVFRIDLRLRPQGHEGELAISLKTALKYYASSARDWERQALIKIRHSAGDISLGREFIRQVQPQIYAASVAHPAHGVDTLNFAAIKTALVAREKLDKRRMQPGRKFHSVIDVKLDHGGIRDIEFLVQCLQRVHGGAEPWLRSGGTMFSLQKLHDKRLVTGKEFHDLTSAYEFLRHLEHRLQLKHGQQTHQLPSAESELNMLQRSMQGYAPQEYEINDLVATVRRRMAAVSEIYKSVIYQQQSRIHLESSHAAFRLDGDNDRDGDSSDRQMLERLAQDSPALHKTLVAESLSPHGRRNLFRFLSSSLTSSLRYANVIRNPQFVIRAFQLFERSDYLSEILIRHPEEITTLGEVAEDVPRVPPAYLFTSPLPEGRAAIDPVFEYAATSDMARGEKMGLLRKHFRHRILAAGAYDLASMPGVYRALTSITSIADDAILAAYKMAGAPQDLSIMAVGRLGSGELDVLSDVDLLFVEAHEKDRQRHITCAQQIMESLSAYTRDGMIFQVDTRLRPRGSAGELLATPSQLLSYFEHEAQPWEALTYTKLRFVAGSASVGDSAIHAAENLYRRFEPNSQFAVSLRSMREKLSSANYQDKSFRTSPGGTYDIDFLTGYLLIRHGIRSKNGNLRDRIWRCSAAGHIDKTDAARLDHAAEFLRTADHVGRLCVGRPQKWLPKVEYARTTAEKLISEIMNRTFRDGLEAELEHTRVDVREIYERLMA